MSYLNLKKLIESRKPTEKSKLYRDKKTYGEYDSDAESNASAHSHRQKSKKLSKARQCINLFSLVSCRQKKEVETANYKYQMRFLHEVRLVSTTRVPSKALEVATHLGMVDSTIYRRIYIDKESKCNLDLSSYQNNKSLGLLIEKAVRELNEIIRSKVKAIGGNCVLGYRVKIIKLKEEYNYSQAIFVALQATGDAVELHLTG